MRVDLLQGIEELLEFFLELFKQFTFYRFSARFSKLVIKNGSKILKNSS
jgi:hypothetical protein